MILASVFRLLLFQIFFVQLVFLILRFLQEILNG